MKTSQHGFSLIELMIVVAIIAILAGIAIPSYSSYMMESRRSDAYAALLKMADQQERFYLQNNAYAAPGDEASVGGTDTENHWYEIEITAATGSSFTLTATPVAGAAQANDTDCPTLTLTSAGAKGPAGCW